MECEYCYHKFSTRGNLILHQKRAKYCLKLRNITVTKYQCEYCYSYYSSSERLVLHKSTCSQYVKNLENQVTELTEYKKFNEDYKQQVKDQINEYKQQIKDLQNKLQEVAIKGVEKSTTTNSQTINLLPLTEEHMRNCAQYLTMDHIKDGSLGYAKYALEHPFKDRLICADYSRKKLKYKNENGEYVSDPDMANLAPKFFKCIEDHNDQLIDEYIYDYQEQINELEETPEHLRNWEIEDRIKELRDYIHDAYKNKTNVKNVSKGDNMDKFSLDFVNYVIKKILV